MCEVCDCLNSYADRFKERMLHAKYKDLRVTSDEMEELLAARNFAEARCKTTGVTPCDQTDNENRLNRILRDFGWKRTK
jgi:hypothetical protein